MIRLRAEGPGDEQAIYSLTEAAFREMKFSDGDEQDLVNRLRDDGDLTLSLVVEENGAILGHIAFSPVTISDGSREWFGLGPVSVEPARQGEGTGSMLVNAGLDALRARNARGCVLLGDPAYYFRFGFRHDPQLKFPGPPPEYFQFLLIDGAMPSGEVRYSPAFG
jgi:predicted N-acetyltransferase YhbS